MASVPPPPYSLTPRVPPASSQFAREHSHEKRLQEAEAKLKEFPDRVPVILEAAESSSVDLRKRKYLVPGSVTVAQFFHTVRKRVKLTPEQGFYLYVDNTLPLLSMPMSQLYQEKMSNDRFLYLAYGTESTFGATTTYRQ